MSAVTINIPAEHVPWMRRQAILRLAFDAEPLTHVNEHTIEEEELEPMVAAVKAMGRTVDQIGWADAGAVVVELEPAHLRRLLSTAIDDSRDRLQENTHDVRQARVWLERTEWLTEQLEGLPAEAVPA